MKIVIDVPEEQYENIMSYAQYLTPMELTHFEEVIKNGTPLPKRHGRLRDLDFVAKRIKAKPPIGEIGKVTLEECYQEILQADTIIEKKVDNKPYFHKRKEK